MFFQAAIAHTEDYLWVHSAKLNEHIHQLFLALLKCSLKIKNKTLNWLCSCLKYNHHRGKIWNTHAPELNPAIYTNVTDGFMINVCNLMMRLCHPFCSKGGDEKILKVDPTYCSVSVSFCILVVIKCEAELSHKPLSLIIIMTLFKNVQIFYTIGNSRIQMGKFSLCYSYP